MQGRRSLNPRLVSPLKDTRQPRKPRLPSVAEFEHSDRSSAVEDGSITFEGEVSFVGGRGGFTTIEFENFVFEETPQRVMGDRVEVNRENEGPRVMGDYFHPKIGATSNPIVLCPAARGYELKPNHFNLLPTFHGMANEDALSFIRDYSQVLQSFPLADLNEDQLKMRCFSYALKDKAKSWLMSFPANSLGNWQTVVEQFMLRFYPQHKTQELRSKLMRFTQEPDEPLHEARERFKELQRQCPHHHFPLVLLCQFFYDGLLKADQEKADDAAGGNIAHITAEALDQIFDTMASNSLQKASRRSRSTVNSVEPGSEITRQLAQLMREMQDMKMKQNDPPAPPQDFAAPPRDFSIPPCGICMEMGHTDDVCPNMGAPVYEGGVEAYAMQGFPPRQPYEPRPIYEQPQPQFNYGWRNQNQGQGSGSNSQFRRPPLQQSQVPMQQFSVAPSQFSPKQPAYAQQYQHPPQQPCPQQPPPLQQPYLPQQPYPQQQQY